MPGFSLALQIHEVMTIRLTVTLKMSFPPGSPGLFRDLLLFQGLFNNISMLHRS